MNRLVLAAMMAAAVSLPAQDANPIGANMKQSWTNIKGLLTRMAERENGGRSLTELDGAHFAQMASSPRQGSWAKMDSAPLRPFFR